MQKFTKSFLSKRNFVKTLIVNFKLRESLGALKALIEKMPQHKLQITSKGLEKIMVPLTISILNLNNVSQIKDNSQTVSELLSLILESPNFGSLIQDKESFELLNAALLLISMKVIKNREQYALAFSKNARDYIVALANQKVAVNDL